MFSLFDRGFKVETVKPYLKMATQRIAISVNKRTNAIKIAQREVASLLAQGKDEKAAIKVESIIREDATIEAYGIIELLCDLIHERARLIEAEKVCPEDLKPAIHTIIWAANRADIQELHQVKEQFVKKYGKEWVERAERDEDHLVNERVSHKLSIRPPSASIVDKYLREIAQKNNVNWTPTERLPDDQAAWQSMPAPTGVSVPMAPGTAFSHLYTAGGGGGGGGAAGAGSPPPAGGGGGGGGPPVVVARPVSPSPPPAGPGSGKEGYVPVPPALPQAPPAPTAASTTAPTVEALPVVPAPAPSAPEEDRSTGGSGAGGDGNGAGGAGGNVLDIPLPPTTTPVLPPAAPLPELPPEAPSTGGDSGSAEGLNVDDLEARFARLAGRPPL